MNKERDVLDFWFGEIKEDWPITDRNQMWWHGETEVDESIINQFLDLLKQAKDRELDEWKETAHGRLALIILLDQFSRNVFRRTKHAFTSDEYALSLAIEGIAKGQDKELALVERVFFYMPFMHSEDLGVHNDSISLYQQLLTETNATHYEQGLRYLNAAKMHRDIIVQFGRYPHRNEILGRCSTESEVEYLRNAEKFGQG